jgi:hypothetical protein
VLTGEPVKSIGSERYLHEMTLAAFCFARRRAANGIRRERPLPCGY